MEHYRYILEKYKTKRTRYTCPSCRGRHQFTRYINTETGEYLHESVGKCNREQRCDYHYTPKEYFRDNKKTAPNEDIPKYYKVSQTYVPKPTTYIPKEIVEQSIKSKEPNYFVQMLVKVFGQQKADQLVQQYYIGTSNRWPGATIFWQNDTKERVRTGKIMLFNQYTFKRIKKPYNHINWVHSLLYPDNFELEQCLFGEHLLKENKEKVVAIVESEKTAVIAAGFCPEYIWIATGGLSNLTPKRCKALKGRNVILYPDLGCFKKWEEKAEAIDSNVNIIISDMLELNATAKQREEGLDIADYLLKQTQWINKEMITPIQLSTKEIIAAPVQTNLSKDFNKAILLFVKTSDGKMYDLIFDTDGEYLSSKDSELIQEINVFFDKKFQIGHVNGIQTYINLVL
jgi:hypothetical protein